jgi:hypothetical protein
MRINAMALPPAVPKRKCAQYARRLRQNARLSTSAAATTPEYRPLAVGAGLAGLDSVAAITVIKEKSVAV